MEEIKVGEYVRTKEGSIDKVIEIANNYVLLKNKIKIFEYGESRIFIKKSDIVKHSSNIIELIEKGDIIDWYSETLIGYYGVNEVINRFGAIGVYPEEFDNLLDLKDLTIKSIVTKEQYNANCYKVEK